MSHKSFFSLLSTTLVTSSRIPRNILATIFYTWNFCQIHWGLHNGRSNNLRWSFVRVRVLWCRVHNVFLIFDFHHMLFIVPTTVIRWVAWIRVVHVFFLFWKCFSVFYGIVCGIYVLWDIYCSQIFVWTQVKNRFVTNFCSQNQKKCFSPSRLSFTSSLHHFMPNLLISIHECRRLFK